MTIDRQAITDACDSPIEAVLIPTLVDGFHDGVEWEQQRTMRCGGDTYRADLWASAAGRTIVIECDGKAFHDYRDDELRDLRMLVRGGVTDVLRFTGGCIVGDAGGCVGWARHYLPFLFDPGAAPMDPGAMASASRGLSGTYAKPTLRTRHDPASPAPAVGGETWRRLAGAGDGVVWEYRWPYAGRGRKSEPSAIGDVLTLATWDWSAHDRSTRRAFKEWEV